MIRYCLFLLSLGWCINSATAQIDVLMRTDTVRTCFAKFMDSGGTTLPYSPNENHTIVLCPPTGQNPDSNRLSISFNSIDLAAGDMLCFFDGIGTSAPSLGCFSDFTGALRQVIRATAPNTSGCITVTFNSNATEQRSGWDANIICDYACQTFLAKIDYSSRPIVPVDTGWIDLCVNEPLVLRAKGEYLQNDRPRHQSDSTTQFAWNFGDGRVTTISQSVERTFTRPGGYILQLQLTDTATKCKNINFINQRIRVAPKPKFELSNIPTELCANSTVRLNSVVNLRDSAYNVGVRPGSDSFPVGRQRSDSLALPDGNGLEYRTTLRFNDFSPGQTLTNINDLLGICINMEHSYIRDLEMAIICPNGQRVILHNFVRGGNEWYMGQPNDGDLINPIPGRGFDYCWTPVATQTLRQYIDLTNVPAPRTVPAGSYAPFQTFNDLLGCPLNGDWSVAVRDLWASDNGFIFSWAINFNRRLYPAIETFSPVIVQHYWTDNPFITQNNRDSIIAIPRNAGTASFTYRVVDNFQCTHDTAINIKILPYTNPNCFTCNTHFNDMRDTSICTNAGGARLNKTTQDSLNQSVTFEAFPYKILSSLTNPTSNPVISPVNINSLKPLTITDVYTQLDSVCVDLNTRYSSDMIFKLKAPGIAAPLLLASQPAVSTGRNLRVCFSPNATAALGAATPVPPIGSPYTGNYQITAGRNGWTALNGATVNGDWQLQTADASGANLDTLLRWSITLKNQNKIKYTWTPATGLSCTDCPNPTANPTVNTRYIVTTIDSFRCTHKDTVNVTVGRQTPAPLVVLDSMGRGYIVFTWNPIAGATGYEVNVNNTGWVAATRPLIPGHDVTGLRTNDVVDIQVRAITSPVNVCGARIGTAQQVYGVTCTFDLRYDSLATQPISCHGGGTEITFTSLGNGSWGGSRAPDYYIDGVLGSSIFADIRAGYHFGLAIDNEGCRDSLYFYLAQPAQLRDSFRIDSVKCNGTNTGMITTLTTGGTGTLRYNWNNSARTTAILDSLRAGTYLVTITDQNGCTKTDTARVYEPTLLTTTMGRDSVRCASANTGRAWVQPQGGTRPYLYAWDNSPTPSMLDTANSLITKWYHVTITDNKNCIKIDSVFVPEPDTLQIRLTTTEVSCFGGSNGGARANIIGGTAPFSIRWSNGDVGATADTLSATRYEVTVTDAHGCTENTSFDVAQKPKLNLRITASNPKCYGSSDGIARVQVTGGFGPPSQFNYNWNNNSILDSIARNLSAGVHQIIVTDLLACRDTQRVTLVNPDSLRNTLTSTPTACSSTATGSATVVTTGGTGGTYQYAWTAQNVASGTTATIQNLRSGWYVVTARDSNNCVRRDSVQVGETQPLVIDTIFMVQPRCFAGTDGTATVVARGGTAGAGGYRYLWSDRSGQTANLAVQLAAGSYTVTVSDVNNCQRIGTTTVTQPPQLIATGSFNPVKCRNGSDGQAFPIVTGGTRRSGNVPSYNYVWAHSPTTATDSIASGLRAGSYLVSVTDANGCLNTATVRVTEPPTAVTSSVRQTIKGCHRTFTGEAVVTALGGSPGYNYRWSNNAATSIASSLAAGWQYVTVTDTRGCVNVDSILIQTYDSIRVYLSKTNPRCFGVNDGMVRLDSVKGGIGNGAVLAYSYQWNTIPVQVTPNAANLSGDRSYTVTVTDNANCQSTGTVDLITPSRIQLTTEVKNVSCFGLGNGEGFVRATGSANLFTYKWDSAAAGQLTQRARNLIAGNYRVTVTDTSGCTGETSLTVTQPSSLRINNARITPNQCVGDLLGSIELQLVGGTPQYKINWSNNDSTATITRLRAGTYAVTITDLNDCKLIDSVRLQQPNGVSVVEVVKPVKCYGNLDGSITLNATGGTPPYRYSTDEVIFNGINSLVGLKAGDHNVYILDNNNCKWFNRINVPTPPKFTINVGPDRVITLGDSTRLSADAQNARGNVTFTWKAPYDSTLSCKICPAPMAKPLFTIQYNVSAKDTMGCLATDELLVTVEKPRLVVVPTGFTPNADNVNDVLYVHGREGVKVKVFKIYDRWGELVFAASDFKPNDEAYGWDGKFHGEPMNTGIFVWFMEVQYLDGATDVFKGNFTLLR
jgi:gliding motility-associated-like protein